MGWLRTITGFRLALLAAALLAVLYLAAAGGGAARLIEGQLFDLQLSLRPAAPTKPPLALVLIDDRSIVALGRWPVPRRQFAALVRCLAAGGARVIALDLLFAEAGARRPGGVSPGNGTRPPPGNGASASRCPASPITSTAEAEDGADTVLGEAMRQAGNVVLPFSFLFTAPGTSPPAEAAREVPPSLGRAAFANAPPMGEAAPILALKGSGVVAPVAALAQAAAGLGHANVALDRDGSARFDYPIAEFAGRYYPSFAVEVARVYWGVPRARLRAAFGEEQGPRGQWSDGQWSDGLWFDDRFVPMDSAGRMVVNYRPPGRYPAYSMIDVLEGRVPAEAFRDRAVLVGPAATGIPDTFTTPFSALTPGVERYANVVESLIDGRVILRRPATRLLDAGAILLAGAVIGLAALRFGLLGTSLAAGAVLAVFVGGTVWTLWHVGWWLDLGLPALMMMGAYLAVAGHGYFVVQRDERRIRGLFKHYLHPALVEELSRNPALSGLGGEQKELTVLFADIRDFTSLSERLPPSDVVSLLNGYFNAMTREILDAGGMLDKYVGDGLVAVFGAPVPQADHAERACRAALAMRAAVEKQGPVWRRMGLPALEIGIGINTGPMVIGNMGSELRFDYTVIGDEVNLASRLQGATRALGVTILISDATRRQVEGGFRTREIGPVTVRGRSRPVVAHALLGDAGSETGTAGQTSGP